MKVDYKPATTSMRASEMKSNSLARVTANYGDWRIGDVVYKGVAGGAIHNFRTGTHTDGTSATPLQVEPLKAGETATITI